MAEYRMPNRQIPLDDSWDVIVVGGGPAGCAAATAAAREGRKTLLIESTGCLGGMGTMGMVPGWCPFTDREKIVYKGIAEEVFMASKKSTPHVPEAQMDWVPINSEQLKLIYDRLVTEAGVKVLFNTVISAVEMEHHDQIDVLIASNKRGLSAYKARVYIDGTGDADVAIWAGAEYAKGDEKNGNLQPATLCFSVGNVNMEEYRKGPWLHTENKNSPIYSILNSSKYPRIRDPFMCENEVAPGLLGFNAGHVWGVDNTNPQSVSDALLEGREIANDLLRGLSEFHPDAFEDAFIAQTAPLMGVRETRRIIGDYILTREDYFNRQTFPDEIGRNSYYLDIHLSEEEVEEAKEGKIDMGVRNANYGKGESHGIPYRCLTPRGISNLLVAGRSISCDRTVQGSVRVMPVCLVTGQAAGTAAALACAQDEVDVHALNIDALRKTLRENGAYFL
ncbi:MAG TPA: FAD-dependent oxidoreductase [Ruminococcaceae bacterium]|nr:FAD-dependent oxidoreductase [Oscillospiraceae bacterium]